MENSSEAEEKSLEFQGGKPKIEEKKQWGQCKKIENSRRLTVNLNRNSGGINYKLKNKIDILNRGGIHFSFLEKSNHGWLQR